MTRGRTHHPAVVIAAGAVVLVVLDAAAWLVWLLLHVALVLAPGLLVAGAGVLAWRRCHLPAVRVTHARPAAWLPEAGEAASAEGGPYALGGGDPQ